MLLWLLFPMNPPSSPFFTTLNIWIVFGLGICGKTGCRVVEGKVLVVAFGMLKLTFPGGGATEGCTARNVVAIWQVKSMTLPIL